MPTRRQFLGSGLAASLAASVSTTGCTPSNDTAHITGGFQGVSVERGHALRDHTIGSHDGVQRKTRVLIAGGGVAGLAAARALRLRGIDDFALLELEDSAGGNARGTTVNGIACPMGAHYLPTPGDHAPEVQNLLEELGLRRRIAGRWVYDERHLCHSPQERLWFHGAWQDGLLPVQGVGADTLAQYQRFAQLVEQLRHTAAWTIPASKSTFSPVQKALAATTFIAWLAQQGLTDAHLRWYLDYCCRDDYGAGIATVSAWAGIHYFASRHGFTPPGQNRSTPPPNAEDTEGLLTWPEGNAWLTRRMAAPLSEHLHTGRTVLRIAQGKHGVEVDAFHTATRQMEHWRAEHVIVALPIFIAARVLQNPPDFLRSAAQRMAYAPWLVANIHIAQPLNDRPGAAPSWDNVLYDPQSSTQGLGYVDAMHQSLLPVPSATVLTHYRALGDVAGGPAAGRQLLLQTPWAAWRDTILRELHTAHPDLPRKATRIDLTRYGHAMAIPVPQADGRIGHTPVQHHTNSDKSFFVPQEDRITYAHSDWAGYSVFEEAFTLGHYAGKLQLR